MAYYEVIDGELYREDDPKSGRLVPTGIKVVDPENVKELYDAIGRALGEYYVILPR